MVSSNNPFGSKKNSVPNYITSHEKRLKNFEDIEPEKVKTDQVKKAPRDSHVNLGKTRDSD